MRVSFGQFECTVIEKKGGWGGGLSIIRLIPLSNFSSTLFINNNKRGKG